MDVHGLPKYFKDSGDEGAGTAMRASIPMERAYLEAEAKVADLALDVRNS